MSTPAAIYMFDNCNAAFQLNWALALFWHDPPDDCGWLAEIQAATEPDSVRILKHDLIKPCVSQFLVSTQPEVAPERIVWSVKGRLQHALQRQRPKAFRRNYGLRSIGSATRDAVEHYVRSQVAHHPMADLRGSRTCSARFRSMIRPSIFACRDRMPTPSPGTICTSASSTTAAAWKFAASQS